MPRLFFALQPEPAQRSAIAAGMGPVVQAMGARPTSGVDLHMTLAFLGQVPAEGIPHLLPATDGISRVAVQLLLTQLDCWKGSRVLCLLPDESPGLEAARRLAGDLCEAVRTAGFTLDAKHFRAHVTIARRVPSAAIHPERWPERLPSSLPFTANGFVLMESTRDPAGPRYKVIHAWPAAPADV